MISKRSTPNKKCAPKRSACIKKHTPNKLGNYGTRKPKLVEEELEELIEQEEAEMEEELDRVLGNDRDDDDDDDFRGMNHFKMWRMGHHSRRSHHGSGNPRGKVYTHTWSHDD